MKLAGSLSALLFFVWRCRLTYDTGTIHTSSPGWGSCATFIYSVSLCSFLYLGVGSRKWLALSRSVLAGRE